MSGQGHCDASLLRQHIFAGVVWALSTEPRGVPWEDIADRTRRMAGVRVNHDLTGLCIFFLHIQRICDKLLMLR